MIKLDTPKKRFWFAIACLWFIGWTIAHILGALTPAGFKPVGWFLFGVAPIFLVWGAVVGISRLARWVKSGA